MGGQWGLRAWSPGGARDLEPLVAPEQLAGAAIYWDCLTDDARLVLTIVADAHRQGAVVINHAPVVELLRTGERVAGAVVRDALSGRTFEVRARTVVNATGPWAEKTSAMAGGRALRLRPTRGSHIVVARERLETHRAIIFPSPRDRRNLYLVPIGRYCVVGTTETDYPGDPAAVFATAKDVAYLLEAIRATFPSARLGPEDIVSTFAGVRPLLDHPGLEAYSVPRDYRVVEDPPGLISVAGGKLTTFRRMAQDAVDAAARSAGGAAAGRRSRTSVVPVAPLIKAPPDLDRLATHAVRHEMAVTLCDCLIRRLGLIHALPDQGLGVASEAARLAAPLLGWTDAQEHSEIEQYRAAVALTRRWQFSSGCRDADGL